MRLAAIGRLSRILLTCAIAVAPQAMRAAHGADSLFAKHALLGSGGRQMLLRADKVDYDLNASVAIATGHVEIDYNDRILQAERVTYDEKNDIVTADGHVIMMAPDGSVAFAQHATLSDQMHDAVIESFAALIGQNGRLAAPHATRTAGVRTVLTRGIFTPCKVCNKPGQRTPLWDVRAARVVYDEPGHRIYYRDAVVELLGVPVLYTPYFTHPDPTVKHATGILIPDIGSHSTLGYFVRLPVYIAFNDSQDMTIAPLVSQKGGEQLEVEYRQRWDVGGMWLQASVANDPSAGLSERQDQTYGSLFGSGIIPISNVWHFGYDAQLTSYATYLQLYSLSQADRLTNDLFIEGISGRSRFAITGYFFQGLRAEDNNSVFPVVLPLVEYSYIPQDDLFGGQFRFDLNTTAVSTQVGEDDQRLSTELRWRLPYVMDNGQLLTFQLDGRGDLYHMSNVNALGPTGFADNQYVVRGAPYAALDWRWPFVSAGTWGMTGFVVEPIVQLIAAPYGDNPAAILHLDDLAAGVLNGDSSDFQLDETNIFSFNRLPGYDLVESGPRANFGIRTEALFPSGSVELLVGQAYRPKPDPLFAPDTSLAGSGYSGVTSDLVSRLTVTFAPHLSMSDRIDVNSSTGTLNRNEVNVDANYGRSSLEVSYLRVPPEEALLGLGTREEVKAQALVGLWDYWLVYAAAQRDLAASQMISQEVGFGYEDECLGISLSYRRQFTEFRTLLPSTSVILRFTLKTNDGPTQQTNIFPQSLYAGQAL
jgi:LPS-assembly protein